MEKELPKTVANEVVKEELANKNSLDLTTTDSVAVSNRLKAIDVLGQAIKDNLIEGINDDFAVIPNTSKPALLLPGARKICMLYGLTAQYPVMNENNNMLTIKCELYYQDKKVSESYGACLIGKQRDLGWEYNKALKIAQKRAMVGATLQIANLSKLFTQDTEDMSPEKQYTAEEKKATYDLSKWFYKKRKLFFTKATAKDCWKKFIEQFKKMCEWKKLAINSVYELGCNKQYADWFIESEETCCGTFKCEDIEFTDLIGTENKKEA